MRKQLYGRQFNRDTAQRQVLFKGLMRSLAIYEGIKTTEAKAKSIRGPFEKLITRAKDGEVARYHLVKHVSEDTVDRLIKDIAPRMKDRAGGYTRIIRLGTRTKDNAEMVLLELVEKGEKKVEQKVKKTSTKKAVSTDKKSATVKAAVKETPKLKATGIKRLISRQKKGQ